MVNRVTIIGRLTRDPEVHDTASGGRLANLRLVTSEYRKDEDGSRKEEVQYHSVVAFGKLGDICADYLRKGRLVYIEGKLRTREWEGKDGLRRYTTEVVADQMKMLSPKPAGEEDANGAERQEVLAGAGAA
ncbi:MAG: single-strand DNA-binding protein [Chloroflexota bacterium]|jgi:single-strand DNA-binding protein|nr:single-strand DNA-binding protein [Chloroflexota bacterium]